MATGLGIESRWGGVIFCTLPDRPCGPTSLLFSRYRVFPGVKGPGVDNPPPSSVEDYLSGGSWFLVFCPAHFRPSED